MKIKGRRNSGSSRTLILPVTLILAAAFLAGSFGVGEITGNPIANTEKAVGDDTILFYPYQVIELGETFLLPKAGAVGADAIKLVNIDKSINELEFESKNIGIIQSTYASGKTNHFGSSFTIVYDGKEFNGAFDEDTNKAFLLFNTNSNSRIFEGSMIAFPESNICTQINCAGSYPDVWQLTKVDIQNDELWFNRLYIDSQVIVNYNGGNGRASLISGGISYGVIVHEDSKSVSINSEPMFRLV